MTIEQQHKHRRIVRVWHPAAPCDMWHGMYGSAPVSAGAAAYQWNSGETIAA